MTVRDLPFEDPVGAFCRENHVALKGAGEGPLQSLTFGAKDVFHIAGTRTGFGSPAWLATHEPPVETATAVTRLLDAGADLAGKTHTDELAYSLTGENMHYGAPINLRAPDRIPGGSSNGSAAAVTAGLVDFAIGTDCGGSVRLPASYCGIFGMRPTVDRVPLDGSFPSAPPSTSPAGWRVMRTCWRRWGACSWTMIRRRRRPAGCCAPPMPSTWWTRLWPPHWIEPSNGWRSSSIRSKTSRWPPAVWKTGSRPSGSFRLPRSGPTTAPGSGRPSRDFGPGVKERFEWAEALDAGDVEAAKKRYEAIQARIVQVMGGGDVLCLPTSPRVAPLKNTPVDDIEVRYRHQAMHLLCIAGLGGLPQISLPMAELEGLPLGLSLNGPRGADMQLLRLARRLMPEAAV